VIIVDVMMPESRKTHTQLQVLRLLFTLSTRRTFWSLELSGFIEEVRFCFQMRSPLHYYHRPTTKYKLFYIAVCIFDH